MYSGTMTKDETEQKELEEIKKKCPEEASLVIAIEVLKECQEYLKHGGSLSAEGQAVFYALGIEELLPQD